MNGNPTWTLLLKYKSKWTETWYRKVVWPLEQYPIKKIIENEKFQLLRKSKYMGPKKETKYNYQRELCQYGVQGAYVQQNYYYWCNSGNQNDHYTYF